MTRTRTLAAVASASALALGLLAPAVADAAKRPVKKVRSIQVQYKTPCGVFAETGIEGYSGAVCDQTGSAVIATRSYERFVTLRATDASGRPVPFVFEDIDSASSYVQVCGSLNNLAIEPGASYRVLPVVGLNSACPGSATTGTITVTLSNLR